jgi:hypothetical protein
VLVMKNDYNLHWNLDQNTGDYWLDNYLDHLMATAQLRQAP